MAAAAVAALLLAVAGTVQLLQGDGDTKLQTRPPANRPTVAVAPEVLVVQGELRVEGTGGGGAIVHPYAYATDGRFRYDMGQGSVAVQDRPGRFLQRDADGSVRINVGLPPGLPDGQSLADTYLLTDRGAAVAAMGREGNAQVKTVVQAGRPAWRLERTVPAGEVKGPHVYDREVLVVDKATNIVVQVLQTKGRTTVVDQRVTIEPVADAGSLFTVPGADGTPQSDAEWQYVDAAAVRAEPRLSSLIPGELPADFRLARGALNRGGFPTGAEGTNPPLGPVATVVFERGFDQLAVSTRPAGPDPSAWNDTVGVHPPVQGREVTGTTASGQQVTAEVVVSPRSVPHLWSIVDGQVVTIAGAATQDELIAMWQSLLVMR